jgi:hypothetical protein
MRIFIIVILCCVVKIDFWAQTGHLISKNYYSFSLVNGLNRNTTKVENGEKSPENALGIAHGLNFHYTRVFNPKFSLAAGLGFGFLPINLKVKSFEDFEGTDVFQRGYYSRVNFKGFSRLELLASYHQKINDKFELKYSLGSGLIHYGGYEFSSSGGFQDSTGQYKNIYDVNIKFNNRSNVREHRVQQIKQIPFGFPPNKLDIDILFYVLYTATNNVIYDIKKKPKSFEGLDVIKNLELRSLQQRVELTERKLKNICDLIAKTGNFPVERILPDTSKYYYFNPGKKMGFVNHEKYKKEWKNILERTDGKVNSTHIIF